MIVRFPPELQGQATIVLYIIVGIIVFLWGRAIGRNETCEEYKIKDKDHEVIGLREKVEKSERDILRLTKQNFRYSKMYSTFQDMLRAGGKDE